MAKYSSALLALTASLALGAMTVAANAGHRDNGGNNGNSGNMHHHDGGDGSMHHHDDGMGHRRGRGYWHGGLWVPFVGIDEGPHCWWRHGHRHCREY